MVSFGLGVELKRENRLLWLDCCDPLLESDTVDLFSKVLSRSGSEALKSSKAIWLVYGGHFSPWKAPRLANSDASVVS